MLKQNGEWRVYIYECDICLSAVSSHTCSIYLLINLIRIFTPFLKLHYDRYNRRFGSDGVHEPIEWPELHDDIEKFKHEFIYPNIIEKEKNEKR